MVEEKSHCPWCEERKQLFILAATEFMKMQTELEQYRQRIATVDSWLAMCFIPTGDIERQEAGKIKRKIRAERGSQRMKLIRVQARKYREEHSEAT